MPLFLHDCWHLNCVKQNPLPTNTHKTQMHKYLTFLKKKYIKEKIHKLWKSLLTKSFTIPLM